jgi:hypothetical protein
MASSSQNKIDKNNNNDDNNNNDGDSSRVGGLDMCSTGKQTV